MGTRVQNKFETFSSHHDRQLKKFAGESRVFNSHLLLSVIAFEVQLQNVGNHVFDFTVKPEKFQNKVTH